MVVNGQLDSVQAVAVSKTERKRIRGFTEEVL